jgi:hypothetical protein
MRPNGRRLFSEGPTGGCRKAPGVKSCKIVHWRATVDEDGYYCFSVVL